MKSILFVIFIMTLAGCSSYDIQRDPIFEETKIRNARPKLQQEVFDIQESDKRYEQAFIEADLLAERKVGNVERDKYFILQFWREKKEILARKYGIDWKSPAELNPNVCYESYGQACILKPEEEAILKVVHATSSGEVVRGFYRDFRGVVYVGTDDPVRNVSKQYQLIGQGNEWELVGVYIIEE